ncbi:MAG TPA: peptidylprolyl isomerase [Deltaproteobacteria bacterium]|nr:peptidylprolyl isomerase [Deltaproteobacteria bacterium]
MKKLIVSVMVLMAAIAGCTAENTASMAGKVDMNDPHLVAVVGGEKIMDTDIEALLNEIPEQARQRYASVEGKRELVQSLAEIKMLSLEAKKQGIDRSPDVKRKIDFMGEQMLARELAENTVDKITISDEEISGYYHDNKEQFSTGPRVKLRHILMDSESEAQAVLARLKKGEDFSALAREKSRCPSSQQGGDLGWATKGMMVPEFENAAFALKKGQMSEVVKSSYGYHVIMCDDVEAARQLDLEEVRDTIKQQLKSEKSEETVSALIEQAKKNHPVTVNEEYFRKAGEEAQAAPGDETSAPGEGDVGAGGQIEGE